MKIIFTEDVRGKGRRGEVKDLPDGYANFLIKQNKAKQANAQAMSELKGQKRAEAKKEAEILEEAKELKKLLESGERVVELKAKAGADGRLFGSITSKQISQALEKQFGMKIDKRKMELHEPIRTMGYVNVPVKLHNEVSAKIRVHVSEQ
ncbi:50S ribosomal protein L9 [Ligilactobacillus hayakitensis DSM 18933 = JCM 14209]|uniref:Large ribosomal subunit protein bL9 n=1 Tax=Ligilactobacillus hayakitensis DSM 18933 = JCM 14209 TaxID=1423755 RepID=A0A0R1WVK3_9LACO|nr:50S ribosomal protein L9 [Ligilactobacillus hayakitensis]KRM19723.1 50S ribosomal protein L9 [Ligilactobacillus hayakitensis DSM 18933 = JCM 14209]